MNNALPSASIEILMVEDSITDAELMTEAIEEGRLDTKVELVTDGEEAVKRLDQSQQRPDLILLDLRLPKMSGHEVLKHLKADPKLRVIPVVILTSNEEGIPEAYDHHANCCVPKPSDDAELATVVQRIESFWLTVASRARKE